MTVLTLKFDLRRPRRAPDFRSRLMLRIRMILLGSLLAALSIAAGILTLGLHLMALASIRAGTWGIGGLLAVAILGCAGLFWLLVKLQMKRLLQPEALTQHLLAGMAGEMQRAQALAAGVTEQVLADMRKRGAGATELAKMEQRLNSVAQKVKLSSEQKLAQFDANPELLTKQVRVEAGQTGK